MDWAYSYKVKTFFYLIIQTKTHVMSKSILVLCLSMIGTFMFWCFTGVLTSLIAIQIEDPPLQSLDDINSMTDLKLILNGNGSTHSNVFEWANQDERNMMSYKKFIEPYRLMGFTRTSFKEAKHPNVAIMLEDFSINQLFKQCKAIKIVFCHVCG